MRHLIAVLALTLLSTPALAQDTPPSPEAPKVSAAMNVGAMGVITPASGWVGQYVYFGPSFFIPVNDRFAMIPVVTFEAAPGSGSWGFVGTWTLEVIPPSGPIAIDILPSVGQDTTSDGTTIAFWAVGPGFTTTLPNALTLGGAFQVSGVIAHPEAGLTFYPMVNFGIPFP